MVRSRISKSDFVAFCRGFFDGGRQGEGYFRDHEERLWQTYRVCDANIADGASVVSVGAGSAYVEHALVHFRRAAVTVMDFPEAIEAHCEAYARSGFDMIGCDLTQGMACGRTFDLALSCEIIEHIPRPPMEHVQALAGLLAAGGKLVVTTPNFANLRNVVRLWRMRPIMPPAEKVFSEVSYENEGVHRREYVPAEIYDVFARCGLEVVSTSFTENKGCERLQEYIFHAIGSLGLQRIFQSMIICGTPRTV